MKNINFLTNNKATVLTIILVSLIVRTGLFFTVWDNLRHGSASAYGSSAIGFYYGQGVSTNQDEINNISSIEDNFSGNYLKFYRSENRIELTEFLPGPAILCGLLWKLIPNYNFKPYIIFQIILDTLLILIFYLVFIKKDRFVVLFTTIFMLLNIVAISKTLMAGYDFWPQFAVLGSFIGIYIGLLNKRTLILFYTGILLGIMAWFRSTIVLLPLFIAIFIFFYETSIRKKSIVSSIKKLFIFILPVIILTASLGLYRYRETGDARPTRSTFWHSFFAGVGRFPNPYDLESADESIFLFGQKKLNNQYSLEQLRVMCKTPNSIYENTLKKEAFIFIKENPHLFLRNTFYRIFIMISPPLHIGNTSFINDTLKKLLFPVGLILLFFWVMGLLVLYKKDRLLFYLCASIYLYFFSAFSWFYVPGRVILPFLFINIMIYLYGIKFCYKKLNPYFSNTLNI